MIDNEDMIADALSTIALELKEIRKIFSTVFGWAQVFKQEIDKEVLKSKKDEEMIAAIIKDLSEYTKEYPEVRTSKGTIIRDADQNFEEGKN